MKQYKEDFEHLQQEMAKVIVGQKDMIEQVLISIVCNANALLEGYPGLAKTLAIRTMADLMDLKFSRIQNTPDLMPSDITGTYIIDESSGRRVFKFQKGPIFANIVLADEINRATPKSQSAMLEAMQEKQVTAGSQTFEMDKPFFVLATQNPIEQEGTYPLPEAQADRFLLKIDVGYPTEEEERAIVDMYAGKHEPKQLKKIFTKEKLLHMQQAVRDVPIANDVKNKAVKIVNLTRTMKDLIEYGASPRASIGLIMAAKARAMLHGRNHVGSEDVEAMAYPILRHRIILNFEAERKGMSIEDVIKAVVKKAK